MAGTVKEEAQKLRQNLDKVYAAGLAAGGGSSEEDYNRGYDDGVEDGKQTEYDRFWDAFQQNGNRVGYAYAFRGVGWTDETFKPKYDIVCDQWDNYMFTVCKITDLKGILENLGVTIDTSKVSGFTQFFANSPITRLPAIDMQSGTSCFQMFGHCRNLQEIEINNVREELTGDNAFINCYALTTFKITGTIGTSVFNLPQSSLLTNESVQNIIDHLKDLTGQTAQKVTFHSDVILKLTDEQIAAMAAKNWTF